MRTVVVAAGRTPQGRFLGSLSKLSAVDLAKSVGRHLIRPLSAEQISCIDEVILGNVLGAGAGMNIARQVSVGLGLPQTVPAYTVNMMCASGIKAIMLACDAIRSGQSRMILCGGTESMSQAPYLLPKARSGMKLGHGSVIDSVLQDGLICAFDRMHMGQGVERLAKDFLIGRQQQDQFALESQRRYTSALAQGHFSDQMVSMPELTTDEHPRPETTIQSLAKLPPAFEPTGSVTAGNASGINDGAALLILASEDYALQAGLTPLASIDSYTVVGCDPAKMGLGPVYAIEHLMKRRGQQLSDFGGIEINEAFAVQTLACIQQLGLDCSRVNVDGGAIAIGHPIGATGARLVVHLAHQIYQGRYRNGLASLCVGGGMGAAMTLSGL